MKKWIVIIISLLFLLISFILLFNFSYRKVITTQDTTNEKISKLEKEITSIKNRINLLKTTLLFWEKKENNSTWDNEIIKEKKLLDISIENCHNSANKDSEEIKTINNVKKSTNSIIKKIWYINKISKNNIISFNEITILSKEECEWLEICFKDESKSTTTFILYDNVEIYSYFVNYLVNWEKTKIKKVSFDCFLDFFNSDDSKEYTRFNKIPYRITLENEKIIKIEEQDIAWLYK